MFTAYRVKATGQWCSALYENGGADAEAVSATYGVAVEAVEAEDDPREGDLLTEPEPERLDAMEPAMPAMPEGYEPPLSYDELRMVRKLIGG